MSWSPQLTLNYIIIQSCPSGPTGSSLFNLVTSKSFANKIKAVISFLNISSLFMQSQTNQMQCLKKYGYAIKSNHYSTCIHTKSSSLVPKSLRNVFPISHKSRSLKNYWRKKFNSISLFHTNVGHWPRIIDYQPYLAESRTRNGTEWPRFSGGWGWECALTHHSGGDARSEQTGGWTLEGQGEVGL